MGDLTDVTRTPCPARFHSIAYGAGRMNRSLGALRPVTHGDRRGHVLFLGRAAGLSLWKCAELPTRNVYALLCTTVLQRNS